MEADGEEVYILVLFDDGSVQFVKYEELMIIAPHFRIKCINLFVEKGFY